MLTEIKKELKKTILDEIKNEILYEIKNEILYELKNEILYELKNEIREEEYRNEKKYYFIDCDKHELCVQGITFGSEWTEYKK